MAEIGSWGPITFEVDDDYALLLQSFNRKVAGRWAEHQRIGIKPMSEFLGPDMQDIDLKIYLHAQLGVPPRDVMADINWETENGHAHTLVIGGNKVGRTKWICKNADHDWEVIMNHGEVLSATTTLHLREYM